MLPLLSKPTVPDREVPQMVVSAVMQSCAIPAFARLQFAMAEKQKILEYSELSCENFTCYDDGLTCYDDGLNSPKIFRLRPKLKNIRSV